MWEERKTKKIFFDDIFKFVSIFYVSPDVVEEKVWRSIEKTWFKIWI